MKLHNNFYATLAYTTNLLSSTTRLLPSTIKLLSSATVRQLYSPTGQWKRLYYNFSKTNLRCLYRNSANMELYDMDSFLEAIYEQVRNYESIRQSRDVTLDDVIDKASRQAAAASVKILEKFNREHPHPKGLTEEEESELIKMKREEFHPHEHEDEYAEHFRTCLLLHMNS